MAVELTTEEDTTSVGPLDIAKAGGTEDAGPPTLGGSGHNHHSGTELLQDPSLNATTEPQTEDEKMRRKNPLGYSVTPETQQQKD